MKSLILPRLGLQWLWLIRQDLGQFLAVPRMSVQALFVLQDGVCRSSIFRWGRF